MEMLTFERRRLALRREKLEGDLGDDGFEKWNNLGLLLFFGVVLVVAAAVVVVLH